MDNERHKHAENVAFKTESWQSIGYRSSQEDRFIVAPVGHGMVAAVMDGHGGVEAAEIVMENLVPDFSREFRRVYASSNYDWLSIKEERMIVRRTVAKLVKRCRCLDAGTTLSLVYMHAILLDGADEPKMRTHVAIMGDSPVSIFHRNRVMTMPIHSARDNKSDINKINGRISKVAQVMRERTRVLREREIPMLTAGFAGDYLYHNRNSLDSHGIAITRALGDAEFGDLLIRNSEIRTYDLPIEATILIATDGIADDGLPEPIIDQCSWIMDRIEAGEALESISGRMGSSDDNTTMLSIKFHETKIRWR